MNGFLLEWHRHRYFPYEREFARIEVASLLRTNTSEEPAGLRVASDRIRADQLDRLTYFARVVQPDGAVHIPRQVLLESSARTVERDRQSTRYSAHGLHEYKGKFNPQIVRAIGNILGLGEGAWVLDPFCGSGTTLLECAHVGWNAVGVDRNPLAPFIANAKIRALRSSGGLLESHAQRVEEKLVAVSHSRRSEGSVRDSKVEEELRRWIVDPVSVDYLVSWFPRPVLAQVILIRRVLDATITDPDDRAVFEVILSDQLREVSLQEPLDLRVRRRSDAQANYPLMDSYLNAVRDRIPRITRARAAIGEIRGEQIAHQADIRATNPRLLTGWPAAGFDAVITSPPYANALPYIDTQRLSLVLLGMISASQIGGTERSLIGAREIATGERLRINDQIMSSDGEMPSSVRELCRKMLRAATLPGNGFRRQNTPALLWRYCCDMAEFFRSIRSATKSRAPVALVVGQNRTTLGGQEFAIDTPKLLVEIAEHCGYRFVRRETMDTYPRYDLHRRNAIAAEDLVVVAS